MNYWRVSFGLLVLIFMLLPPKPVTGQQIVTPEPTPTVDRLAIPQLPENPTPFDMGLQVYYYNCMPCHGDYGQGLTVEWMSVWEEDHQNCWGRGCHGSNENYTFFIPTVVPAVVGVAQLPPYDTEPSLYQYLKETHPPQHPGKLSDEDYRNVSVYLMQLNNFDLPAPESLLRFLPAGLPPAAFAFAASLGILVTASTAFLIEKRGK